MGGCEQQQQQGCLHRASAANGLGITAAHWRNGPFSMPAALWWAPFDTALPQHLPLSSPPASLSPRRLLQAQCTEAFAAVRHFEGLYCVADAALPPSYLTARPDWFSTAATFAAAFSLKDEVLHDALLLLDRAVAAGGEQLLGLNAAALLVACLLISARQGE